MSPVENANDPREAKDWIMTPISATGGFDPAAYLAAQARFNVRLKRETKLACFSGDGAAKHNRDEEPLDRGWAHPRMWAHYGGGHAGVCLPSLTGKRLDQRSKPSSPGARTVPLLGTSHIRTETRRKPGRL